MLFDNAEIEKIRKEAEARGNSEFLKKLEPGEQLLTFSNIELKSAKDKNPMIIITLIKTPDYRPLMVYLKLAGSGSEIHKSRIVEFLETGMHHVLKPCKDEDELIKQFKTYIGKTLKVAIKIKTSLFDIPTTGETVVAKKPELWYFGHRDDKGFQVNMTKVEVPLQKEDLARFNSIVELTGKTPRTVGDKEDSSVESVTASEDAVPAKKEKKEIQPIIGDDLPF